jgi:hypothetical protein
MGSLIRWVALASLTVGLSGIAADRLPLLSLYTREKQELVAAFSPTIHKDLQEEPGGNPLDKAFARERMPLLAAWARRKGWKPLSPGRARFIHQPWGKVGDAFEVDLQTGRVTLHQSSDASPAEFTLKDEVRVRLLQSVISGDFRALPSTTRRAGLDGQAFFIEIDWDGYHQWLFHWSPDSDLVRAPFRLLESIRP